MPSQADISEKQKVVTPESRLKVFNAMKESLECKKRPDEIIYELKDSLFKNDVADEDVVNIIWKCVIFSNDWNKSEDLIQPRILGFFRIMLLNHF